MNFFWRGPEIVAARAALATQTPSRKRVESYARAAAELGDRALDPVDPLRAGPGIALAVTLYGQAFRAALAAHGGEPGRIEEALKAATKDEDERKRTRDLLETQDLSPELAAGRDFGRDEARRLRVTVRAMLAELAEPERRLRRVRLQRWTRMGLLFSTLTSLVAGVIVAVTIATAPANLLSGRPSRTSSSYAGFLAPARMVDGQQADIFFHTNEDEKPWIDFDLGAKTKISEIRVVNRGDCCADRAIPLVLEASDDRVTWKEIVRRDRPFTTWSQRLSVFSARYVRLRVDRQSWLHLEKVELH